MQANRAELRCIAEASGCLVGPAVFKTVEGVTSPLAGSIPVRLRYGPLTWELTGAPRSEGCGRDAL